MATENEILHAVWCIYRDWADQNFNVQCPIWSTWPSHGLLYTSKGRPYNATRSACEPAIKIPRIYAPLAFHIAPPPPLTLVLPRDRMRGGVALAQIFLTDTCVTLVVTMRPSTTKLPQNPIWWLRVVTSHFLPNRTGCFKLLPTCL